MVRTRTVALVCAALLISACTVSADSTAAQDGSEPTTTTAVDDGATDPGAEPGADLGASGSGAGATQVPGAPGEPAAALAEFRAPDASTGLPPAQERECPGADPAHVLSAFPDARPFEATSLTKELDDGIDEEFVLECRISFEMDLDPDDECTLMEVREIVFTPAARSVIAEQPGALATTSMLTYFSGGAMKEGVVLSYTVTMGCDEATDLSDLEDELRSVWVANRDAFMDAPTLVRPD